MSSHIRLQLLLTLIPLHSSSFILSDLHLDCYISINSGNDSTAIEPATDISKFHFQQNPAINLTNALLQASRECSNYVLSGPSDKEIIDFTSRHYSVLKKQGANCFVVLSGDFDAEVFFTSEYFSKITNTHGQVLP